MGSPPQADQIAASRNIRDSNPVLGTKPPTQSGAFLFGCLFNKQEAKWVVRRRRIRSQRPEIFGIRIQFWALSLAAMRGFCILTVF